MNKSWIGASLSLAAIFAVGATAKAQDASAVGFWVTPESGSVVEIKPCDSGLCGSVVGMRLNRKADESPFDVHNPDKAKQNQPICGLVMAGSLKAAKGGKWEDGWVYDPEHGETYNAEMKLDGPNTLKLRGYLGISLFGRTMTWTREPVSGNKNRCEPPKAG